MDWFHLPNSSVLALQIRNIREAPYLDTMNQRFGSNDHYRWDEAMPFAIPKKLDSSTTPTADQLGHDELDLAEKVRVDIQMCSSGRRRR